MIQQWPTHVEGHMYTARQLVAPPLRRPARLSCLSMAAPEPARASMPTNDEFQSWILAVADAGDRQAFAALFKHFAPRVKAYLMRSDRKSTRLNSSHHSISYA